MKYLFVFLFTFLSFTLFLFLKEKQKSIKSKAKISYNYIKKLYSYRLYDGVYITSVQYIDYEKKLKLIILTKQKDVSINKCKIIYSSTNENCNLV